MPNGKKKNAEKKGKKAEKVVVKVVKPRPSPPKPKAKKQKAKTMKRESGGLQLDYSVNTSVKPWAQRNLVLRGCDYLAAFTVTAGAPATLNSAVISSFLLNPISLVAGSRLSTFAGLFDKFRFRKLVFRYMPTVPTTTSGQLFLAADPDVYDSYLTNVGDGMVAQVTSTVHNTEFSCYRPATLEIRDKAFFNMDLYVDPQQGTDARFSNAGRFMFGTIGAVNAGTFGRLYVEWEIEFKEPSIDAEAIPGTAGIITVSGTYITSTYPWGDFSAIIAAFTPTSATVGYLPRPFVQFSSDATLGSVITFNAVGFYLVTMNRTGSSMGSGAFSGAVLSAGVVNGWPQNNANIQSNNFNISNGLDTASSCTKLFYVSTPGATISATNDSGVTHTTGYVYVSRVAMQIPVGINPINYSVEIDRLRKQVEELVMKTENKERSNGGIEWPISLRKPPAPAIGVPVMEQTTTGTTTTTFSPGSGAPVQTWESTTENDSLDEQIAPIEVIPPAASTISNALEGVEIKSINGKLYAFKDGQMIARV